MKVAIVIWKDPKRWKVFSCSEVDELGCSSQEVHCAGLVCVCVCVCVCVHMCLGMALCVSDHVNV